jgi:hypothetical protein
MSKTQAGKIPDRQRYESRKIRLDPDVYCAHSRRESDGDVHCDHDFEDHPNVRQPSFAIWNCTVCGRAVRFDLWH